MCVYPLLFDFMTLWPVGKYYLFISSQPILIIMNSHRPAGRQLIVFSRALLLYSHAKQFFVARREKGEIDRETESGQDSKDEKLISVQTKKTHVCLSTREQKLIVDYTTCCSCYTRVGRVIGDDGLVKLCSGFENRYSIRPISIWK